MFGSLSATPATLPNPLIDQLNQEISGYSTRIDSTHRETIESLRKTHEIEREIADLRNRQGIIELGNTIAERLHAAEGETDQRNNEAFVQNFMRQRDLEQQRRINEEVITGDNNRRQTRGYESRNREFRRTWTSSQLRAAERPEEQNQPQGNLSGQSERANFIPPNSSA